MDYEQSNEQILYSEVPIIRPPLARVESGRNFNLLELHLHIINCSSSSYSIDMNCNIIFHCDVML